MSYSTLWAKRAKFTFWVDKSSLKMLKMQMVNLASWRLRSNPKWDIFGDFQTLCKIWRRPGHLSNCTFWTFFCLFRCRVGLHGLYWGEPTLVALFVHRFRDSVPCHVDHQRFSLLSNDLLMRQNRHYGKRAFNHWRIWSIHQIMARITVRIQVRRKSHKLIIQNGILIFHPNFHFW